MPIITYSQNLEDVILQRVFHDIEIGFYVDIGANHPKIHSVTKAFYDRGWRGINVEPVSTCLTDLKHSRPNDVNLGVVVSDQAGLRMFYEVVGTGLSTTSKALADKAAAEHGFVVNPNLMTCLTLTQILEAHEPLEIHFLKIDVEGAELEVLRGMDFDKYRPWVVVLEATEPLSQVESFQEWEPILSKQRYQFVYSDGLNRYYLAEERAERRIYFSCPPNVFDSYVPYQLVELYDQLENRIPRREPRPAPASAEAFYQQIFELMQISFGSHDELARDYCVQVRNLRDEYYIAEKRLVEIHQELADARQELVAAHQEVAETQRQFGETKQTSEELQQQLQALKLSLSWQLTRPLRSIHRKSNRLQAKLVKWMSLSPDREPVIRNWLKNQLRKFRKHRDLLLSRLFTTAQNQQPTVESKDTPLRPPNTHSKAA